jgi:hypothetical protein
VLFCAFNFIITDPKALQQVLDVDPQMGKIRMHSGGRASFAARLNGTHVRCFELLGVQGMPPEAIMRQLREQQFRVLSAARTAAADMQFWDAVRVVVVARGWNKQVLPQVSTAAAEPTVQLQRHAP